MFSPVECTLSVVALPEDTSEPWPEYKALSYAWEDRSSILNTLGGQSRHAIISCNDCQVNVPLNLFAALVRLRQKNDAAAMLWVDYLCIDQSDMSERNEQVALMQEIFSHSSEVLIWLGEPPKKCYRQYHWKGDDSDDPLIHTYKNSFVEFARGATNRDSILDILADGGNHSSSGQDYTYGVFCLLRLLSHGIPASAITFYESSVESYQQRHWAGNLKDAICDITNRAWVSLALLPGDNIVPPFHGLAHSQQWERTWVVQECVLARKATLHYGHLSASWDMFSQAALFHMANRPSHDLSPITSRSIMGGPSSAMTGGSEDPLAKLCGLILQIEIPRRALRHGHSSSPLQILTRFHGRVATDPRDKVFALLGLISEPFLSADYSASKYDVYVMAAMRIIKSTKSLELLPGAHFAAHTEIPRWSPDWSIPPSGNEWQRLQCRNLYNASRGMPAQTASVHGMPTQAILEADGIWFDRVRYVTPDVAPDDVRTIHANDQRWEDAVRRALGFHGTLFEHGSEAPTPAALNSSNDQWIRQGYAEAFWRATCGDVIYTGDGQGHENSYRRARPEDYESYRALDANDKVITRSRSTIKGRRAFNYTRPVSENRARNQFFYAMQTMTAGRRMFVTSSGLIGVGPCETGVGDRVALFAGSAVPFILKRTGKAECHGDSVEMLLSQPTQMEAGNEQVCWLVHRCYAVVGDAHIPGIMDGEAVETCAGRIEKIYLI